MIQEEMRRGKSVAFRMLFGKSACFVPEFLTLQGVEPGHLRVQAHRETAGYVLSYQEAYILYEKNQQYDDNMHEKMPPLLFHIIKSG